MNQTLHTGMCWRILLPPWVLSCGITLHPGEQFLVLLLPYEHNSSEVYGTSKPDAFISLFSSREADVGSDLAEQSDAAACRVAPGSIRNEPCLKDAVGSVCKCKQKAKEVCKRKGVAAEGATCSTKPDF